MSETTDLASSLTAIRGELSVRIQKMMDLIRAIEYFIDDPRKLEAPYMITPLPGKTQEKNPGTPGPENSTVENARILIATFSGRDGAGLKTAEILQLMEKSKCSVKGKRPIQTLYGILYKDSKSKHPRVRRTKDGYWEAV